MQLTVICREEGYPNNILVYVVDVATQEEEEVRAAVQQEREHDLGDEANPMDILFAFDGNLPVALDWRE